MIGHIGLNVPDLAAARAYYDALMPALDFDLWFAAHDQVAYRPAQGRPGTYVFLYPALQSGPYSRHCTGLQHVAFMLPTRDRVHAVHDLAQQLGSTIIEPPRHYPEYPPPYYATFWYDPHGFMLEAVCHKETGQP